MLNLNPETVCSVIDRAHQFHAKEGVVIPDTPLSPSDDWAMQVLADHAEDMTLQDAKANIDDLEPDQQVELVVLMWLGRGDYDMEEWDEALQAAKDAWDANVTEYLFAHPYLADHLQEGLHILGYDCEG